MAERLALVQEILDSVIAEQPPPPLFDAKRWELDRRIADAKANPADGVPWAPAGPRTLADLLAGLKPDTLHDEWAAGPPAGAEVL